MLDVNSISSMIVGILSASAITVFFAKKYLQSIEERLKYFQDLLHIHDKKIAVIENELIHGKSECNSATSKGKVRKIQD